MQPQSWKKPDMAQIAIKGIRVENLSIGRDEDGQAKVEGTYALISTTDKVLAKQPFNGYQGIKIVPTATTVAAMDAFLKAYISDINLTLGLND